MRGTYDVLRLISKRMANEVGRLRRSADVAALGPRPFFGPSGLETTSFYPELIESCEACATTQVFCGPVRLNFTSIRPQPVEAKAATTVLTTTARESDHGWSSTSKARRKDYLQVRVAPRNLNTGSVPWDPGKHVWPHAVSHQAREQEEDESQLERNQENHVLLVDGS